MHGSLKWSLPFRRNKTWQWVSEEKTAWKRLKKDVACYIKEEIKNNHVVQ
jgi:hypothetical protein